MLNKLIWALSILLLFGSNNHTQGLFGRAKDLPTIGVSVGETVELAGTPQAAACTHWIAHNGNDVNNGTSSDTPKKTFAAFKSILRPGHTLCLKNGTYTKAANGAPKIDGASGWSHGTSTQPITIRAENERRAFLDGTGNMFRLQNITWWNIEGLYVKGGDQARGGGHTFQVDNSSNITIRRNLITHSDRCSNRHTLMVGNSNTVLVEENEVYYFHRHGISLWKSTNIKARRNYTNSRNYPDSGCNGYASGDPTRGTEGITFYNTSDSIMENNIDEGTNNGHTINADCTGGQNNKMLGNIALSNFRGAREHTRCHHKNPCPTLCQAKGNVWENNVVFNYAQRGFWFSDPINQTVTNNSAIKGGRAGFLWDHQSQNGSVGSTTSTNTVNSLSIHNSGRGFDISALSYGGGSRTINFSIGFGNSTSFFPADFICPGCYKNVNTQNPRLYNPSTGQGCIVYIPTGSNVKGAGFGGKDIGANVVHRYVNGTLDTRQKLWNQSTGAFPCGATVAGVNETAGNSCINVHQRLNVGVNNCPIQ